MIIKYGCVTLRAIELKDMQLMKFMLNDPSIDYMTIGGHFPISDKDQLNWYENFDSRKELRCMVETINGDTIGYESMMDIDWKNRSAVVAGKFINDIDKRIRGDVYDGTIALIKYAFEELNLHCLSAVVLDYNIFSIKNIEKCGFKKEGVLRERIFKKGQYRNQIIYSLLKEEFELE